MQEWHHCPHDLSDALRTPIRGGLWEIITFKTERKGFLSPRATVEASLT